MRQKSGKDPVLDLYIEEDGLGMDGGMRELLRAARRARGELRADEAAQVLRRVLSEAQRSRHRRSARGSAWLAGVAALLAVSIGLLGRSAEVPRRDAPRPVAKRVRYESVHEGKVVRLEILVHDIDEKEDRRAQPVL